MASIDAIAGRSIKSGTSPYYTARYVVLLDAHRAEGTVNLTMAVLICRGGLLPLLRRES